MDMTAYIHPCQAGTERACGQLQGQVSSYPSSTSTPVWPNLEYSRKTCKSCSPCQRGQSAVEGSVGTCSQEHARLDCVTLTGIHSACHSKLKPMPLKRCCMHLRCDLVTVHCTHAHRLGRWTRTMYHGQIHLACCLPRLLITSRSYCHASVSTWGDFYYSCETLSCPWLGRCGRLLL